MKPQHPNVPVQPEFACATESTPTNIIMSSGQETIAVKAICGDDIRRFHLPQGAGFESLVNEVVKRFSLEGKQIALKFKDDENEWCSLTTDEDLSEAQSIAKQLTPPILRVQIWVSVEVTGKQHARKDAPTCASAADEFAEAAQKFFFSFPEAAAEAHRMLQSFLAQIAQSARDESQEAPASSELESLRAFELEKRARARMQLADLDGHKHNTELYEEALKRAYHDVGWAFESYFLNEAQTESLKESETPHARARMQLAYLDGHKHSTELYEEALNRAWLKNDVGWAYESYFLNEAQTESLKESETPHTLSLHFLALVPHARSNVQVAGKMRARRTRVHV